MKNLSLSSYFRLMRINHWFKNSVVFVGYFVALWYKNSLSLSKYFSWDLLIIFLIASLVSSSNYVINQITDADFDKKHPDKKDRPIPHGLITVDRALVFSILLFIGAFSLSFYLYSVSFSVSVLLLWIAGFVYNIKPIRLKDVAYFDVISESVNNPIRLLIGWFSVVNNILPPLPVLALVWSAGAILMTLKRYDELKYAKKNLVLYRKTFSRYSTDSLAILSGVYSVITILAFTYISLVYFKRLLLAVPILTVYISWILNTYLKSKKSIGSIEEFVLTTRFIVFTTAVFLIVIFMVRY